EGIRGVEDSEPQRRQPLNLALARLLPDLRERLTQRTFRHDSVTTLGPGSDDHRAAFAAVSAYVRLRPWPLGSGLRRRFLDLRPRPDPVLAGVAHREDDGLLVDKDRRRRVPGAVEQLSATVYVLALLDAIADRAD